MRALLAPLLPLAALAAWLDAIGLADVWHGHAGTMPPLVVCLVVGAALEASWLLAASRGMRRLPIAWLLAVVLSRDGLHASAFGTAASIDACALHALLLGLASLRADPLSWSERLAAWRRARQRIATELRLGDGLLPWARECWTRILTGRAEHPSATAFDRLIADLDDAGAHTRTRLTALTLPDAVRQAASNAVHAIARRAETAAADLALAIERASLDEAAACRDLIGGLTDRSPEEREQLAAACESLLVDLAVPALPRARRTPVARPLSPEPVA
jgi:hypothetical protein